MDATAHFYGVSELLAYAKDKAIDIINVVTHNDC